MCGYRGGGASRGEAVSAPRFSQTFCSQCGDEFGPGDGGFSHCSDHSHAAAMTAKTLTERVTESKQRKRDAGLKEVRSLWAHPDDHAAIRAHAAKLAKRRERAAKQ